MLWRLQHPMFALVKTPKNSKRHSGPSGSGRVRRKRLDPLQSWPRTRCACLCALCMSMLYHLCRSYVMKQATTIHVLFTIIRL